MPTTTMYVNFFLYKKVDIRRFVLLKKCFGLGDTATIRRTKLIWTTVLSVRDESGERSLSARVYTGTRSDVAPETAFFL